jgi:hypothetical protein
MRDWRELAASTHPYNAVGGRDYLAWAKQIMFREQHRDTSLFPIQVTFAKQALNIDQEPKHD